MTAKQVGNCRRGTTKVDGDNLDVGLAHQQFPGEVRDRTGSRGREVELARIGARVGEKLLERLDAERRVDHQDRRHRADASHWRQVFLSIKRRRSTEMWRDKDGGDSRYQQRIAVRR